MALAASSSAACVLWSTSSAAIPATSSVDLDLVVSALVPRDSVPRFHARPALSFRAGGGGFDAARGGIGGGEGSVPSTIAVPSLSPARTRGDEGVVPTEIRSSSRRVRSSRADASPAP